MTPQGLTRLRIADLIVELPADLDLPDVGILEEHLRPFAWAGQGEAEVVVVQHLEPARPEVSEPQASACGGFGPADRIHAPRATFRVDVTRVMGRPGGEERSVLPYLCTEESSRLLVAGPLPDTMAVVSAVHLGLAHHLPRRGGLLLHASAVRASGWSFVFPGPTEAGKTTAAQGFHGGTVLTDERCAVRQVGDRWLAFPVPMWGGKYAPVPAAVVPLAMVVVVRKNAALAATPLSRAVAVSRIAPGIVHNSYDVVRAGRVLGVLAELATEVPVVELAYGLGDSFAEVLAGRLHGVRTAAGVGGN
jgi:hypothetical protein